MFASTSQEGGGGCFTCGGGGEALVLDSLKSGDADGDNGALLREGDDDENDETDDDSQTQTNYYDGDDDDNDLDAWTDLAFVTLDEESEYYSMQVFRKYHGPVADAGQDGLPPPLLSNPCQIPTVELPTWEVTRDGCHTGLAAMEEPVKEGLSSAMHAIDHTVEAFVGFFLPLRTEQKSRSASPPVIIQALRPRIEVEDEADGSVVYSTTEKLSIPRFVTLVREEEDSNEPKRGVKRWWFRKAQERTPPKAHDIPRKPFPLALWRIRRKEPRTKPGPVAKGEPPEATVPPPPPPRPKTTLLAQVDRSDDDSRSLGSLTTKRSWNLTETSSFGRAAPAAVQPTRSGEPEPSRIGLQIFAPVHVSKSLVYLDEIPPPETLNLLAAATQSCATTTAVHAAADESSYHSFVEPAELRGKYFTEEEKTVTDGDSSIHTIRILRVPTENLEDSGSNAFDNQSPSRSRSVHSPGASVRHRSDSCSSPSPRGVSVRNRSGSRSRSQTRGVSTRNRSVKTFHEARIQPSESREELLLPTLSQSNDNESQDRQYVTEEEKTVTDGDSSIHMIRIQRVPTDMRRKPSTRHHYRRQPSN